MTLNEIREDLKSFDRDDIFDRDVTFELEAPGAERKLRIKYTGGILVNDKQLTITFEEGE